MRRKKEKIYITKPVSPSKLRLFFYFSSILKSRIYTNDGKYLRRLENSLSQLWAVDHVVVMTNGTMPLICLMEMVGKGKNVLTTPFTFVATTNAIIASGNKPVFVDIERETLQPSPKDIELVLDRHDISAVMLTQVFGLVPKYREIEEICRVKGIPLFFDSSHSFGVEIKGTSPYGLGDATTASFHSTKNFSTIEGGAVVTDDGAIADYAKAWRNFGIVDGVINRQGTNAKMHEFSAAFGLAVLPMMKKELSRRNKLFSTLTKILDGYPVQVIPSPNASYFPVIFTSEAAMLSIKGKLEQNDIFPRRYFYPSIDELSVNLGFDEQVCPVSRSVAQSILCLPLGSNVTKKTLRIIEGVLNDHKW